MNSLNYKEKIFNLAFQEYFPPFFSYTWTSPEYYKMMKKTFGYLYDSIEYYTNGGHMMKYIEQNLDEKLHTWLDRINKEPELIEKYEELYQSELKFLQAKIKKLQDESFSDYSNERIVQTIKEIFFLVQKTNPFSNCFFLASQILEKDIRERWKNYSTFEVDAFMSVLTRPLHPREYDIFKQTLKKILDQNPELKNIKAHRILPSEMKVLKQLAKEFYWLTSFSLEPRTPESFIEDLRNFKYDVATEDIVLPNNITSAEQRFLQLTTYVKDQQSTYVIPWYWFTMRNLWNEIIKRVGLNSVEDFWMFTHDELVAYLKDKKIVDPQDVQIRKEAMIMIIENGKLIVEYGDKAKKIFEDTKVQEIDYGLIKEVKGQIAYPGKIRGSTNVILNKNQFTKFSKGEILVAPYTAPEYVPLMKKAIAIITDLGGITSHAAIVSRELGIPCIVGTRNATRVFKDGDIVEVDAEKGIVRKL